MGNPIIMLGCPIGGTVGSAISGMCVAGGAMGSGAGTSVAGAGAGAGVGSGGACAAGVGVGVGPASGAGASPLISKRRFFTFLGGFTSASMSGLS